MDLYRCKPYKSGTSKAVHAFKVLFMKINWIQAVDLWNTNECNSDISVTINCRPPSFVVFKAWERKGDDQLLYCIPVPSMYCIFNYIWLLRMVNIGNIPYMDGIDMSFQHLSTKTSIIWNISWESKCIRRKANPLDQEITPCFLGEGVRVAFGGAIRFPWTYPSVHNFSCEVHALYQPVESLWK